MMPLSLPTPEQLRAFRLELGLTQAELARAAGVSQPLIARVENGSVDPRFSTLRAIVHALNRAERQEVRLREVMQAPVVAVRSDDPVGEAIRLMQDRGFSQLPVVSADGAPVGGLSERTMLHALAQARNRAEFGKRPVREIMGPPFPTAGPETTLDEAYALLEDHAAVVVMERGALLGIVAKADVLRQLG